MGRGVHKRTEWGLAESEKPSRSRRAAGATRRARRLRAAGNDAEAVLWSELKARRLNGHKFVRQWPVGPYIADFACREKKLIVELDGSQHLGSAHDESRDAFLNGLGFSVLRVWSVDMLRERQAVLETIVEALDGRLAETVDAPDLRFRIAFAPAAAER